MYLFAQKHIQHWLTGCSLRLAVVTAAGKLVSVSDYIGKAIMPCIPIFFAHGFYNSKRLLFCFRRSHCSDEARFFYHDFILAALIYYFIFSCHITPSYIF